MISWRLFFQRLIKEWKFQTGVIKTILDWTVIVYIVIPGLVIFSSVYRSWWYELPEWAFLIPSGLLFFIFFLFAWVGQIRTYIQDADQLFLLKHHTLFLRLKIIAATYSIVSNGLMLLIIFLLSLPFLMKNYLYTVTEIVSLYVIFFSLKLVIMSLKIEIKRIDSQFVQKIVTTLSFIMFTMLFAFIISSWNDGKVILLTVICIALIAIAGVIIVPYVKKQSEFHNHLLIEKMERVKYIDIIFSLSYDIEKTNVITRKRPLLFRKSQRIFKKRTAKRGFIELFIKVFIRNSLHITSYFQLIFVTSFAIIVLPPMWMKITIFLGGVLVLSIWSGLVWEKIILAHPLTKKFGQYDDYFSAKRLVTNTLVAIGSIILLSSFLINNIVANLDFFQQIYFS